MLRLLTIIAPKGKYIASIAPYLDKYMPEYKITGRLRVAAFLAQLCHESGGFNHMRELGGAKYFAKYDGRKDLGNTEPGDGARFRGRGLIQLTGRGNYGKFGNLLGIDLIDSPQKAEDPEFAVQLACLYWTSHHLNELADQMYFTRITRLINGGTNGLQDRLNIYHKLMYYIKE